MLGFKLIRVSKRVPWETGAHLSYMVNTIAADVPVTPGHDQQWYWPKLILLDYPGFSTKGLIHLGRNTLGAIL